jgi:signal transduction histidine kinase
MRLLFITFLFTGLLIGHPSAYAKAKDEKAEQLLNDLRKYFNDTHEDSFYLVANDYRQYNLEKGDLRQYYKGYEDEILHDINFNHFYRAMKKAKSMQDDMFERKCSNEYFRATYLIGMIYSMKGNLELAKQYFEKAIKEVDNSNPDNLINIYFDLANIEMDQKPAEALKHLEAAISIIKDANLRYEYSDAIGFKTIIAFIMHDWQLVDECYREYRQLEKEYSDEFSYTYFNYVMICKLTRDGRYNDAMAFTQKLTNATDRSKFQLDIIKETGDNAKIVLALERYQQVKDSVNNVIMSEELIETANDLEMAKMEHKNEMAHLKERGYILIICLAAIIIFILHYFMRSRRLSMQELKRKNKELEIARDKAQESERMKTNFLNNMNHEIRTPLNIISGFAQIVSSPNFAASPEERQEISNRIQKSSSNITRIIEELLDISNKESVRYITKEDNISCNELIREAINVFEKPAHCTSEILVKTDLRDSFMIKTNKEEVQKALECLLNNACKFTENGTITVRSSHNKTTQQVEISVTDNGKGIPEEDREKIFNHFYKIDNYKDGIGLGLPLARRIARQLGGDVTLDTNYTDGARFIISLPLD